MALVTCPDCNKTRIPTWERIIAKDYCQCFATIQIENLGTVTCKHSGVFTNGEFSLRFEPASNGEADECDIVVFDSEGDIRRYENLTLECLHEGTKVYSGESWICSTCGQFGGDELKHFPSPDGSEFRRLWKLFGHGE